MNGWETTNLLGTTATVSYSGSGATPQSIASALATAIQNAPGSTVTAKSDGDVNILVSDSTGTATDYSVSASTAYDTADFTAPSFAATAFSMGDGLAADTTGGQIYGYYVPAGGYAANGNLVASSDSVMGDWIYGYDTLNRLTGAVNALSTTVASQYAGQSGCWAYDPFGNRALESYQTTACSTSYTPTVTYNGNNQVTKAPSSVSGFTYDAAGNVLNDGLNQYAYDGEGRLCAVKNSVSAYVQYVYDASGTRVAKGTQISPTMPLSCPAPTSANLTPSALYLLDQGGDRVTELNGSGAWQHSNAHAGGTLATYALSTAAIGVEFQLTDPLGTRRILTDATGKVQQTCLSLPYGNGESCPASPTEQLFTGKERDAESGNDYFPARYYSSPMGRWMSPDWSAKEEPVPYAQLSDPQSLNLYSYVRNNPLARVDIDGHCVSELPFCGKPIVYAGPPPGGPPKIQLPPGKSGKPNGWKPVPDNPGGSRVKWSPKEPVPGGKDGAQPSASWNEKKDWWSVNDGQKGPIQHVDGDGNLLDENGQPIPDGNGGFEKPTIGQPAPAPTPGDSQGQDSQYNPSKSSSSSSSRSASMSPGAKAATAAGGLTTGAIIGYILGGALAF